MQVSQSIHRPTGINVFGSFVLRVEPNLALVRFAVWRVKPEPSAAFAATREALGQVRDYLAKAGIPAGDVQSSHIQLSDTKEHRDGSWVHAGYRAKVQLTVRIAELARFEEFVAGGVEAGVNEIEGTEFATAELAEHRAQARRGAFAAARRKAELYAEQAGVGVGEVLHVEDVNPVSLRGRESHGVDVELPDDGPNAAAPGSIEVKAAVMVTFSIDRGKRTRGFG